MNPPINILYLLIMTSGILVVPSEFILITSVPLNDHQ